MWFPRSFQKPMNLTPAFTYPSQLVTILRQQGYAVLSPSGVCELAGCRLDELNQLVAGWDDLPPDNYLKDGGATAAAGTPASPSRVVNCSRCRTARTGSR